MTETEQTHEKRDFGVDVDVDIEFLVVLFWWKDRLVRFEQESRKSSTDILISSLLVLLTYTFVFTH